MLRNFKTKLVNALKQDAGSQETHSPKGFVPSSRAIRHSDRKTAATKAQGRQSGFSLIEVLVALMIMVGAIIIVSSAWSGNFLRVRKANLYNNVSSLLQQKIAEIEAEYKEVSLEEIPEERSGDFGEKYPQYSWTFESKEFQMPDMSAILTAQQDTGANEMLINMIKQYTEMINQSVKEGTVSVIVKAGGREVKYSVTTYFVNYDVNLGGIGGGGGLPGGGQ